jgi:hypothetical protein
LEKSLLPVTKEIPKVKKTVSVVRWGGLLGNDSVMIT